MFPIPDPSRLLPPKVAPRSYGPTSLSEGLLALAGFPMLLAFTIGLGAIGNKFSSWLAIPAGLIGLGLSLGILESTIVCGLVEAIFYGGITFLFSGGLEKSEPGSSVIGAIVVATVFLFATHNVWRKNRA